MTRSAPFTRRSFLVSTGAVALTAASGFALPSYSRANARPVFTHGVQSGDVDATTGMIWTRTDRPARVSIEVSTTESFTDAIKLPRSMPFPIAIWP